ncbi:MAG: hypothetical protein RMI89_04700 [Gloeomargarita sp. SKYBB_i_bin120]|nr:hypothetical protein [Gloeomargarita sp. SKYG98]MCS7292260.1 hypothetical protein [Gloeomargarita sp. SKYB120]MDW8177821.1 hypothetical protein [Gloeomargarita sp. SKYBB_i_bin120]
MRLARWGVGVMVLVAGCQLGTRWQLVEGNGFQVRLPGKPQYEERQLETPVGDVKTQAWEVNRPQGSYALILTDYNQPVARLVDSPLMWAQLKAQAQQRVQGQVTRERAIQLGPYPGREITLSVPPERLKGGGIAQMRFYFVGQRVYGLYAIVPQNHQGDLPQFFDSFQVTGTTPTN